MFGHFTLVELGHLRFVLVQLELEPGNVNYVREEFHIYSFLYNPFEYPDKEDMLILIHRNNYFLSCIESQPTAT
jgi:hypothetical protein